MLHLLLLLLSHSLRLSLCHFLLLLRHLHLHGIVLLLLNEGLVIHLGLSVVGLLAHHLLLLIIDIFVSLRDRIHLFHLFITLGKVGLLELFSALVQPFNLRSVGSNLCLVVFELGNHLLELLSALFQISLILVQLFGHIGAALLRKDILELDVELFFLLNKDVFL